jgi:hypothetical protein
VDPAILDHFNIAERMGAWAETCRRHLQEEIAHAE